MISDILKLSDKYFGIEDIIRKKDYGRFAAITDSLLREIERKGAEEPMLHEAYELLHRFHARDLYKFIGEIVLPESTTEEKGKQ